MRSLVFLFAVLLSSTASAQEPPSSWMLLLRTDSGVAFAPTTYDTESECLLVAVPLRGDEAACTPAHYPASTIKAFEEQRAANDLKEQNDAAVAKQRLGDLEKQRPALEAERRAIVEDRNKLNQQKYAKRVLEIDALLRELN